MLKLIISIAGCVYLAAVLGEVEGLKCFHCYDSFNDTLSLRSVKNDIFGEMFVRCDKNKNNWNTWFCPVQYPICVVMSGRVKNHTEIIRSCGQRDVCKTYRPPSGVTVETCRECDTSLCNDYLELPTPRSLNSTTTTTTPSNTTTTTTPTTTSTTTSTTPTTTSTTTSTTPTTTSTTTSTTPTTTSTTTSTTPPNTTTSTTPTTTSTTTSTTPPNTTTSTTPTTTSTTTSTTPSSTTTTTTPSTTTSTLPPPPSPPVNPNVLFKFNINIKLNVIKHPKLKNEFPKLFYKMLSRVLYFVKIFLSRSKKQP